MSEQVLAWVARQKHLAGAASRQPDPALLDDLRRIELCALATREACMFFDLYGIAERTDS